MTALRSGAPALRDLRSGGTWSAAQTLKNGLLYRASCFALWLADRLPETLLLRCCQALALAAYVFGTRARAVAQRNLRDVLGAPNWRQLARQCFLSAGQNLGECLLLRRRNIRVQARVTVPDSARVLLDTARASGCGAVFVSAHLGPFELLAAALAELGYEPAIVVRESYDPRLNRLVDAHRTARGIEVIHRGSPAAALRIVRALRAGRPVGLLPDLGGRVPCVEAEFLGQRVAMPVGPARIAERARAHLLVGVLRRVSHRDFVLDLSAVPAADDVGHFTQRTADLLSAAIRRQPAEWLWMAPRFPRLQKNRPERYT